jgi:hypothetical protein
MNADDEKFFAWLDGELSGPEAAEMEAKVAADPTLAKLADQHRALRTGLKAAFDTVSGAPVPDRLNIAARRQAEVVDFGAKRRNRSWMPLPQWAAMAATLVLGIAVGTLVRQPATAPVELQNGRMYATSSLRQALDTQLASEPGGGNVRIGITFRNQAGAICRTFTAAQSSGLACREGDRWKLRGLFSEPESQSGEYRMAAGMDPNLAGLVDSTMTGQPFDGASEKAAKQRGWR